LIYRYSSTHKNHPLYLLTHSQGARPALIKALTHQSASAISWLQDSFDLDLSIVNRLGAHSFPRTHRGSERFPGMTITYALMEKFEEVAEKDPQRARLINKARVVKLLNDERGVTGVEYEKDGQRFAEYGKVVLATGGFGADFSEDSLLKLVENDWRLVFSESLSWSPEGAEGFHFWVVRVVVFSSCSLCLFVCFSLSFFSCVSPSYLLLSPLPLVTIYSTALATQPTPHVARHPEPPTSSRHPHDKRRALQR
jgi:hypothetical protein